MPVFRGRRSVIAGRRSVIAGLTRNPGLLAFALGAIVPFAAHAEEVTFPSLDGTLIPAQVLQPAQQPPRGTVIVLHGCGGLYSTLPSREGMLSARHQGMADLLAAEGYAAVFPDSLTPRGAKELCTQKIGSRRIDQAERRADVLATMAWVAAQPWARADHIAVLGWSHGGSAVLAATDRTRREVRDSPVRPAVAIAFYPGCSAEQKAGYQPSAPLVLMLADKDDWTPSAPCVALGQAVRAEVNLYADSYHDFDNPTGEVRLRRDVPNGVHPGEGVHAGRNPLTGALAWARVRAVLREKLR
jgi:dienelactone hydrolase